MVIFAVGVLSGFYLLYRLAQLIILLLRPSSISRYHHGNQPWALITGASDGIGFAFAQELSHHGFDIILHGRNPSKLSGCQARLEKEFPDRKFRIFVADVTQDSAAVIAKFVKSSKDLCLTVLINNVGGTKGFLDIDFKTLSSHTTTEIADLANANMHFSTLLTTALLPILARQQPSLIINTGSTSDIGMPYLSVYAATKAYIAAWSFGLKAEMQAEGLDIEVHDMQSGTTQSNQNRTAESLANPSARTFAKAAIAKVGCGRVVVPAWWFHHMQTAFLGILPEWAQRQALVAMLKPLKGKGLSDH